MAWNLTTTEPKEICAHLCFGVRRALGQKVNRVGDLWKEFLLSSRLWKNKVKAYWISPQSVCALVFPIENFPLYFQTRPRFSNHGKTMLSQRDGPDKAFALACLICFLVSVKRMWLSEGVFECFRFFDERRN